MAVLDWIGAESGLRVEGDAVRLRTPRMANVGEWAELRRVSRAFLQPWEPTWPADDLTRAAFRRRLSNYQRDQDLGHGYAFFIHRREDDRLVGGVNLRNILRGVAQMGSVGYWVGQPFARRGFTLDAVETINRFAFEQLGLHRVEAACCPENDASRGLLLRAGFEPEGRARSYLKINGVWRDHLLFGRLRNSD